MLGYDLLVVRGPGEKVEKVSRKSRVDSERSNEGLNPGPIKSTKTSCPTGFENERIEHICSRKTTQSSGTQNRDSTESLKQKKVWKKASWTRGAFSHSTKKTCEIDDENKRIVTRLLAATSKTSSVNAAKEHDLHISNAKAATVARRRIEEEALDAENLKLFKRLQAVIPSSDVDRNKLQSQYAISRAIRDKMTTKRVVIEQPPGIRGPIQEWTDRW